MMVQLEGPIVQSVYDTAILSWWTSFNPRLPLLFHSPEYPEHLDAAFFQSSGAQSNGGAVATASPILLHSSRNPFPIALVNRTPRGRKCCMIAC